MRCQFKLIVGGLPRGVQREAVLHLVEPCGESRFELIEQPGLDDQTMAVVRLGLDQRLGGRLCQRLDHREFDGRRLWAWLSRHP